MAEGTKIREKLEEEGTCPICKDYYTNPVTLICGHNFCSTCMEGVIQFSARRAECPLCKEVVQSKTLRPNRQLSNMLEVVQDMSNLLKYRGVCSVEEAEKKFAKDQINRALEILRKGREDILGYTAESKKESQDMLDVVDKGRKDAEDAFRQIHMALKEQEEKLLTQTDEIKNDIVRSRNEHLAVLSEELSSLEDLIQETKNKLQDSGSDLQKISGDILKSCKKKKSSKKPFEFPADLMWKIHDCSDIAVFLEGITKKFQATLESGLELNEANVKLYPFSVHPLLVLSEDRKSVRFEEHQDVPDDPEIYEKIPFVVGQEGFLGGRHFWDVAVSNAEDWSVGVAIQTVKNKDNVFDGMKLVEMGLWDGAYRVFNFSNEEEPESDLNTRQELKKIRVIMNYGAREVGFYNADTGEKLIVEFINVPLEGVVLPYFSMLSKGHLTLCPQDNANREHDGNQPHQLPPAAFA